MAALLTAGWVHLAGRDRAPADAAASGAALQRAADAWDKGDYVTALTTYQDLLSGPDAASALEPIALQTGELFRTIELTPNGANPVFSPDSRHFAFETGPGVSAGVATGVGRTTHVRTVTAPDKDVTTLDGADASFCPDGRSVAFLRVPLSPEITAAQAAVAAAATTQERAPRQQALARLMRSQRTRRPARDRDRSRRGVEYRRPAEDRPDVRRRWRSALRRRRRVRYRGDADLCGSRGRHATAADEG